MWRNTCTRHNELTVEGSSVPRAQEEEMGTLWRSWSVRLASNTSSRVSKRRTVGGDTTVNHGPPHACAYMCKVYLHTHMHTLHTDTEKQNHFQKSQVQFLEPKSGGSQLPVTPTPGDPTHKCHQTGGTHRHRYRHIINLEKHQSPTINQSNRTCRSGATGRRKQKRWKGKA